MSLQAVTPTRILDTRTSNGGHLAPFNAGETFPLQVLGRGAVPTFGVDSVQLNVTVVAPLTSNGGGYLTLYPSGRPLPQPTPSSINFAPGWTIANQVLVPVGADGAVAILCGFASGVRVVVDVNGWMPSELGTPAGPSSPFSAAAPSPDAAQANQILDNAVRYLLDPWWSTTAPSLLASPIGPLDPGPDDALRRMGMAALALSTSALLGRTADPAKATQLIDRVASTHFVNTPGGWGEYWQTGMWAGIAGRAAWFMWADLGVSVRRRVAKMVEFEANWALRMKVKYLRTKAGTVQYPGDSGAEEVSWQSLALQVACVMLPNHPMRPHWLGGLHHLALAAWARPADANALTVVNGRALSAWLDGSNVEPDGTVVNHNRVAPDYATSIYQTLDTVPLFLQAGQPVPRSLVALLSPVYAAIGYDANGAVVYPQPSDWGTGQILPFALADALAQTYSLGAGTFLETHLDAVLTQQARHPDGHTYEPGEYLYVGAEEHAAQLASQLALALHVRDHHPFQFDDSPTWV